MVGEAGVTSPLVICIRLFVPDAGAGLVVVVVVFVVVLLVLTGIETDKQTDRRKEIPR